MIVKPAAKTKHHKTVKRAALRKLLASRAPKACLHIEGDMLVSIYLKVARGTGPSGSAVVTRLNRMWLTFDGSGLPKPGQTIRVTDAAYVDGTTSPAVFRADRIATAVWTLRETP